MGKRFDFSSQTLIAHIDITYSRVTKSCRNCLRIGLRARASARISQLQSPRMSIIQIATDVRVVGYPQLDIHRAVISPRFVKIYEAWNIVYTRDGMSVSSNSRVNYKLRAHEEVSRIFWANPCRGYSNVRLRDWIIGWFALAKSFYILQRYSAKKFDEKCKGTFLCDEHGRPMLLQKTRFTGIDFRETTSSRVILG